MVTPAETESQDSADIDTIRQAYLPRELRIRDVGLLCILAGAWLVDVTVLVWFGGAHVGGDVDMFAVIWAIIAVSPIFIGFGLRRLRPRARNWFIAIVWFFLPLVFLAGCAAQLLFFEYLLMDKKDWEQIQITGQFAGFFILTFMILAIGLSQVVGSHNRAVFSNEYHELVQKTPYLQPAGQWAMDLAAIGILGTMLVWATHVGL